MFGYASRETPELMPLPIMLAHKLARQLSAVRRSGQVPVPAPGRQDPGDDRVRGRQAGPARHGGRLQPARARHQPQGTAHPGRQGLRGRPGAGRGSTSTPPATACWSTRPAGSRSAARWATPGSPAARSSSTPTAAWPGTAAARSPARTRPRWTAAPRTRCAGWPRTWSRPSWPTGARRRSPTRSARPSRWACSSSASAPRRCPVERIQDAVTQVFDLRPRAIIAALDLLRPIYSQTAAYGHFGRNEPDFSWERTDRAAALRAAVLSRPRRRLVAPSRLGFACPWPRRRHATTIQATRASWELAARCRRLPSPPMRRHAARPARARRRPADARARLSCTIDYSEILSCCSAGRGAAVERVADRRRLSSGRLAARRRRPNRYSRFTCG